MSFRRTSNAHDCWLAVVRDNLDLIKEIPKAALETEHAFRDYVTRGEHRGVAMSPRISELSDEAVAGLGRFIHHKTQFDMDATGFDEFNSEYRRRHPYRPGTLDLKH